MTSRILVCAILMASCEQRDPNWEAALAELRADLQTEVLPFTAESLAARQAKMQKAYAGVTAFGFYRGPAPSIRPLSESPQVSSRRIEAGFDEVTVTLPEAEVRFDVNGMFDYASRGEGDTLRLVFAARWGRNDTLPALLSPESITQPLEDETSGDVQLMIVAMSCDSRTCASHAIMGVSGRAVLLTEDTAYIAGSTVLYALPLDPQLPPKVKRIEDVGPYLVDLEVDTDGTLVMTSDGMTTRHAASSFSSTL